MTLIDTEGRKEARGQDEFADLGGACGEQAAKSDFEAKKTVRHVEDWVRRSDENPGKWTNEAAMGQIVKRRFSLRARTAPGLAFGCEVACTSVPVWGFEPKSPSLSLVGHVSPR
jgi:hypothetical protein